MGLDGATRQQQNEAPWKRYDEVTVSIDLLLERREPESFEYPLRESVGHPACSNNPESGR